MIWTPQLYTTYFLDHYIYQVYLLCGSKSTSEWTSVVSANWSYNTLVICRVATYFNLPTCMYNLFSHPWATFMKCFSLYGTYSSTTTLKDRMVLHLLATGLFFEIPVLERVLLLSKNFCSIDADATCNPTLILNCLLNLTSPGVCWPCWCEAGQRQLCAPIEKNKELDAVGTFGTVVKWFSKR